MNKEEFFKKYENIKYLGDGLYVNYDGCYVILRTQREDLEHWVALDFSVLSNFLHYANMFEKDISQLEE